VRVSTGKAELGASQHQRNNLCITIVAICLPARGKYSAI
jgi:hypothetical protein